MATTFIRGEKVYKGHTRAYTVHAVLKYVFNPDKTEEGKWVNGYLCDGSSYEVCEDEFLRRQAMYELATGKQVHTDEHSNVIISMRQSFDGMECSPERAQQIGRELAHEVFGDRFQFVVATHTNTENIHNHIIANIVNEDNRKFHFTKTTWKEVRKHSDRLCRKYGLSVITNPTIHRTAAEKRKARQYTLQRTTNWNRIIRRDIDRLIARVKSYDEFLQELQKDYDVKQGKYLSVRNRKDGQQRFRRLYQLGIAYTEDGIRQRIFAAQNPAIRMTGKALFIKLDLITMVRVRTICNMRRMSYSGYQQWSMIKKTMEACSVYARYDIKNAADLENRLHQEEQLVKSLRTQLRGAAALEPLLLFYTDFKENEDVAKEYEALSEPEERMAFYQEHQDELDRFDDARNYFSDSGLAPDDPEVLAKLEESRAEADGVKRLEQELENHQNRLKDFRFAYQQLHRFDRHYHAQIETLEQKKKLWYR